MKSVAYETNTLLPCATCGGEVIICLDGDKVLSGAPFLEATLVTSTSFLDCCGRTTYRYGITYDETLLVEAYATAGLGCCDIDGIFCRGCLTTWVEWLIDQVGVAESDPLILRVSSPTYGHIQQPAGTIIFHTYPTGANNIFWGEASGNMTNSANDCIGIGYNTLHDLDSGSYNVCLGSDAGNSITNAQTCTFLGNAAGYSSTDPVGDTFVGSNAGYVNTTGDYNTYLGLRAGYNISTGGQNTFVGAAAGEGTLDISNATSIGYEAAYGAEADSFVCIGYKAGRLLKSSNVVAIGYEALDATAAGSDFNLAVGYRALTSLTTALSCTCIGYLAGRDVTIGTGNTAFGAGAAAFITSGTYNTFIGNSAGHNANTSSGYNVCIGNAAGGLVANTAPSMDFNVLIGNNAGGYITDNGNVAIGYQSLGANGGYNGVGSVAIGFRAAGAQASNNACTAIGYEALGSGLAPSRYNTAVGYQAATGISNGESNTLVGHHAGLNLGEGSFNTYLGARCCLNTGTDSYNTVVGSQGFMYTQGGSNVAIGYNAIGQQLATRTINGAVAVGNSALFMAFGDGSTAIGNSALANTANGAIYNTAIGYASLINLTTGTNNTALGNATAATLTTGSKNTCLGDASNTLTNSASEAIAIGYAAIAATDTCVIGGAASATGELSGIGCGVTTPTAYFSCYEKIAFSKEGALLVKLTNQTGANSVKGQVVQVSTGVANSFQLAAVDSVCPLGVVYTDAVAAGQETWIAIKGKAQVYYGNAGGVTLGTLGRMSKTADVGDAAGVAMGVSLYTDPVDASDLSRRLGYILETTGVPGLAYTMLI